MALADEPVYAATTSDSQCLDRTLSPATYETKMRLNRFVDALTKAKMPANHVVGFRSALDSARRAMLQDDRMSDHVGARNRSVDVAAAAEDCNGAGDGDADANSTKSCHWSPSGGNCPVDAKNLVLLVYISRGLLSSIAEPRQVMELIALGQLCLQGRLVINTYALIDGISFDIRFFCIYWLFILIY